jgi:hypothetical protein
MGAEQRFFIYSIRIYEYVPKVVHVEGITGCGGSSAGLERRDGNG